MKISDRSDPVILGHVLGEHRELHAAITAVRCLLEKGAGSPDACIDELVAALNALRAHLADHFAKEERGGFLEESVGEPAGNDPASNGPVGVGEAAKSASNSAVSPAEGPAAAGTSAAGTSSAGTSADDVAAELRVASEPRVGIKPDDVAVFMRAKLDHAQDVIEGLATEDYQEIYRAAHDLALASQASAWEVLLTEEYVRQSADFRRSCEALRAAARDENLDAAALAWMEVTMKCVQCHKYVRQADATAP